MLAFLHRILDWFKNVFWKEEMELALVGLQNSGKTTFVNVISVRQRRIGQFIEGPPVAACKPQTTTGHRSP